MFNALLEVLKDLWFFAIGIKSEASFVEKNLQANLDISGSSESLSDSVLSMTLPNVPVSDVGRQAYVVLDGLPCLAHPKESFDNILGELAFGESVQVSDIVGTFARISTPKFSGWVSASGLTDNKHLVMVDLVPAYVYGSSNEQTIKLRRYIDDVASGDELGLSLQGLEFVLYTLKQLQINIDWPSNRPRLAGDWKTILKGIRGVSMSIEPRTNSVLEYAGNGTLGFLGFVTEVRPDNSIKLLSVGRERDGEYLEEEFTQTEWKEWRPVFISFT